ncbi:chorion peroxidase [Toxorhynchites rutilus septentrionalis]|uniref:chorion peroxidase n=1 Tax=Toxorhynchites rutilus septentrionalis TaxID=329112 RepID=UPI0024790101|nr:chorion peroxidase [Toxorhynchites rutilus septentrionalis]
MHFSRNKMPGKYALVRLFIALCFWHGKCVLGELQLSPINGCGPAGGECVPISRFPSHETDLGPCITVFNTEGLCRHKKAKNVAHYKRRNQGHDNDHVLANALHKGQQMYADKLHHINQNLAAMTAKGNTEPLFHPLLQTPLQDEAISEHHDIYEKVFASKHFADAINLTMEERQMDHFARMPRHRRKRCVEAVQCDPHAHYRSFDGTCNNLHPERTSAGAAGYPFHKLLPPAYEDGVWAPRVHSVSGKLLPSARIISATLLADLDRPDLKLNLLLMQFGQFIAHDITRSSSIKINNQEIECCSPDGSAALQGDQQHFACLPIEVPPNDPFYSKFGVRCLNFVRLELARGGNCKLGHAKQLSKVTHFVDASTVYGSSSELAASLRTFNKGQLRSTFPVGIEMLPFNRNPAVCEPWARVCFEAGDDRVNQIVSLVQVQNLFLREHNRIAGILTNVNPHWSDEKVYQEARKIVVAEIQKILYNEYLPIIVGWKKAKFYGLVDDSEGHIDSYNQNIKPVVFSEVSAAAFRFGHSTVDGHFRIQHRNAPTERIPIHEVFNDPSRLMDSSSFDDYMRSLGDQPQQQLDSSVTLGLAGFLFAGRQPFGSDLASLNIQRGRDHALQPYNAYRDWAGLPKARSFQEFGSAGSQLSQVYEHPDDVDLWIGGLLEPAEEGGLVGHTFGHLIAEQFARLKFGDRFYYTNTDKINPSAFTKHQLHEIGKVSLASIICANVDKRFDFYQAPRAFLKSSQHNVPIPCEKFGDFDFSAWKH